MGSAYRRLPFAPFERRSTATFEEGAAVFAFRSRGKGQPARPVAPGLVVRRFKDEEGVTRYEVDYGDRTSFAVAPEFLVPVHRSGAPTTLVCTITHEYRSAAKTQLRRGDSVVEIGSDLGFATKIMHRTVGPEGYVLGVDKAAGRVAQAEATINNPRGKSSDDDIDSSSCSAAKEDYSGPRFAVFDVLARSEDLAAYVERAGRRPNVVFIDINGSRDIGAVETVTAWVQATWRPDLVVVKSEQMMAKYFPEHIARSVPARMRHADKDNIFATASSPKATPPSQDAKEAPANKGDESLDAAWARLQQSSTARKLDVSYSASTAPDEALRKEADGAPAEDACSICGAPSKAMCARCKRQRYCGAACQRADWRTHRRTACREESSTVPPPAPASSE